MEENGGGGGISEIFISQKSNLYNTIPSPNRNQAAFDLPSGGTWWVYPGYFISSTNGETNTISCSGGILSGGQRVTLSVISMGNYISTITTNYSVIAFKIA